MMYFLVPNRLIPILFSMICCIAATSCTSSFKGAPDRVRDVEAELALLEPLIGDAALQTYMQNPTKEQRNEIIGARLYAIDMRFSLFETALMRERRDVGFLTTLAELAVDTSGALATGEASQILSAISAGITGASESFDKEILIDQTIQALLTQMRANRTQVGKRIIERMQFPVDQYPLTLALMDLEDYYQGGTLVGALVGINESAGLAVAVAEGRAAVTEPPSSTGTVGGTSIPDVDTPVTPTPLPATVCGNARTSTEQAMEPETCRLLQRALCIGEDGVFGSQTRSAFEVVESALGLTVNGQIDENDSWYSDLIGLGVLGTCQSQGYLSTYERANFDPAVDLGIAAGNLLSLRNSLDEFWQAQETPGTPPQIPAAPQGLGDLREAIRLTQERLNTLSPASNLTANGAVTQQFLEAMSDATPVF